MFAIRFPFFGKIVYVAEPSAVRDVITGDPHRFHAGEGNAGPLERTDTSAGKFALEELAVLR